MTPEMLGDLTSSDARIVDISRGVATIDPIADVEGDFSKAPIPMFYGKFPKNEHHFTPKGMSGGPILTAFIKVTGVAADNNHVEKYIFLVDDQLGESESS